jgi:2-hydroxy-6-oxonona-2,4-dienedioate hydrolase
MARAILDYLGKRNIKSFNLLGHSMGGMIAQEIAKLSVDKILKLICYGTGPRGGYTG